MASDGENSKLPEHVLLGMGNPLLDIIVLAEKELHEKYGLKENDAILANEEHIPLFDEILKRDDVQFVPGGATQNALRIFQWILRVPNRSTFFGAVGVDKYSEILRECAVKSGVNVQYQENKNVKTGTCAVLVYQHHRSLCADLAAANTFTVDHLEVSENVEYIKKAKFYYVSGFFLTACLKAIQHVASHAAETNKYFCMNLSAPFIPTLFSEALSVVLPYVDLLFSNEEEVLAYAKVNQLDTENLKEIALKIAAIDKVNKKRSRTVIVTQGPGEIIVAKDSKIRTFSVPPVSDIVDTNGAGDAFCGGFLAELVCDHPLEACIRCACYAASVVIQNLGVTVPPQCCYNA